MANGLHNLRGQSPNPTSAGVRDDLLFCFKMSIFRSDSSLTPDYRACKSYLGVYLMYGRDNLSL
jgi:hypothetical protein